MPGLTVLLCILHPPGVEELPIPACGGANVRAGRAANLGGSDLTQQLFSHVFKNTGLSRFIPLGSAKPYGRPAPVVGADLP